MSRKGTDDSSWQHPNGQAIDWQQVVADGYDWCAIKVTEGTTYVNPYAVADAEGVLTAGGELVLYHFARPAAGDPASQSAFFREHVTHDTTKAGYALDLEDGRQLGWAALAEWVQAFIAATPLDLVYAPPSYVAGLTPHGYPWGLKRWEVRTPTNEPAAEVEVVQDGQGTVPGIGDPVDLDEVRYDRPAPAPEPEPAPADPAEAPVSPVEAPGAELAAGLPNVFTGSQGGYVAALQRLLDDAAVIGGQGAPRVAVDGVFGPDTDAAVRAYQEGHQLAADGVVGPATWSRLLAG